MTEIERNSKTCPFFISFCLKPSCPWVMLWSSQISILQPKHLWTALAKAPNHKFHKSWMLVSIRLLQKSTLLRASCSWDSGLMLFSGLQPNGFHIKNKQERNNGISSNSLLLKSQKKAKTLNLQEFEIFIFLGFILSFLKKAKNAKVLRYLRVGKNHE